VVPADQAPPDARALQVNLAMGRDAHLVHYPVAGGRLVNVVLVRRADAPRDETARGGWSAHGDAAALADTLKDMARPARDLVAAVSDWQVWSLYDLAPLAAWSRGPITLLGDAAHPVPPFLAQGAALAIEDAAILAQEVARANDPAL
jgi:salicylate hydroxylase